MRNNSLGCLTGTGIIATLITAFVIVGVVFAQGQTLFSPGPLNAQSGDLLGNVHSHAEIGANCGACHSAPWDSTGMADKCTACHFDIAVQMKQVASLHGQLEQRSLVACYDCHPDHRGPAASLVDLNGQPFPHQALGFSLNGHAHKVTGEAFVCRDCHGEDIRTFDPATCQNCHRQMDAGFMQAHLLVYAGDCLACHDGVDRFAKGFNHGGFAFKLTGKHASVSCDKCHNSARTLADFALTSQDCITCHQKDDPHGGQLSQDCSACHSTQGWKPANFDHNLSAFKLEGAHASVKCEQCHANNLFKSTPTDCYSCHRKDDQHNGQFGTDCSACHKPTRWDDVTFDHNKSQFPLTGAHASVACTDCHSDGRFQGLSTDCVTCHQDPSFHKGAFGLNCAACHNTSAWSPAKFGLSHPGISGGEGGSGIHHGGASCQTCHPSTVYTYTCRACHNSNNPGDGGGGD